MKYQRILITGGAGFVGSSLALAIKQKHPQSRVTCLDNLIRKGSELQLPRLKKAGIEFIKGDVRNFDDLSAIDGDLMIECSAEPSVQAGLNESPRYLLETNLYGSMQCLEWVRERKAAILFLSTSRVYPIRSLESIPFTEQDTRFSWTAPEPTELRSEQGILKEYELQGIRSLYGTSKYASELLIQEYAKTYGLNALVNRFGVIAGPWQMGKVDQGFFALWVARHVFGGSLSYNGYGGLGKQVRDFLHIDDLVDLILTQLEVLPQYHGEVFHAGGGLKNSVSLLELSRLCEEITGSVLDYGRVKETHENDVRILLLDPAEMEREFNWQAKRDARTLIQDLYDWMLEEKELLTPIFT